jgi:Cd2+/Zn2+-exporting ATPase
VSRPKKMLPVVGQAPDARPVYQRKNAGVAPVGETERTVMRVEGMDCASCAVTVEKSVRRIPGVHRSTVNFAAGRLDAEHAPSVTLAQIEQAVKEAGFGVGGLAPKIP